MIRGVVMEMEMSNSKTILYKLTVEPHGDDNQPMLAAQTFRGKTLYLLESCRIVGNSVTLFWRDVRATKRQKQYVWTSISDPSREAKSFQLAHYNVPETDEGANENVQEYKICVLGVDGKPTKLPEPKEPVTPKPFFRTLSDDDDETEKGDSPRISNASSTRSSQRPSYCDVASEVANSMPPLETDSTATGSIYDPKTGESLPGSPKLRDGFLQEEGADVQCPNPKEKVTVFIQKHNPDYTTVLPDSLPSGRPLDWKHCASKGKFAGWSVCWGELKEGEVITDEW